MSGLARVYFAPSAVRPPRERFTITVYLEVLMLYSSNSSAVVDVRGCLYEVVHISIFHSCSYQFPNGCSIYLVAHSFLTMRLQHGDCVPDGFCRQSRKRMLPPLDIIDTGAWPATNISALKYRSCGRLCAMLCSRATLALALPVDAAFFYSECLAQRRARGAGY